MNQPKAKDPQKELEIALSELEERVDRLRASYEQYFMGFEKIEPGVQRKEVDRRFAVLRKQQIRNTALRFRFNVVTQKFNTYAIYWTRICRQIEEGTFKRHIVRAQRRFAASQPSPDSREQDVSIEVELGDFDGDEEELAAILAEAEAEAAPRTPNEHEHDTVRPEARETARPPAPSPLTITAKYPAAPDPATLAPKPAPSTANRTARHAALPPGTRPKLLVRRKAPSMVDTGESPALDASASRPAPPASAPRVEGAKAGAGSPGRVPLPPPGSPARVGPPVPNRVGKPISVPRIPKALPPLPSQLSKKG